MPTLELEFAGVKLKNPYILASAPPTMDAEHIIKAAKLGWGGAVTKTIGFEGAEHPRPRLGGLRKGRNPIAMENIELISEKNVGVWCEHEIPRIRENAPEDFVLIASIMASPEPAAWSALARRLEETEINMLELNVSCPHGMPERAMGMFIGQDVKLVETVVKACKRSTKLPVMVKLTTNVTDIRHIAKACENAGADALAAINTVPGMIGVDIGTQTPIPNVEGRSALGGLSGPAIRPIALRNVAEIAKTVKIPISGMGGIEDWKNAVEFLLIGASSLQLCTAVMWHGFGIIGRLKKGLLSYMREKDYERISELSGNALERLGAHKELTISERKARIDVEKCIYCGRCLIACADGAYGAISEVAHEYRVEPDKCDGCGLCKVICPADAITLE